LSVFLEGGCDCQHDSSFLDAPFLFREFFSVSRCGKPSNTRCDATCGWGTVVYVHHHFAVAKVCLAAWKHLAATSGCKNSLNNDQRAITRESQALCKQCLERRRVTVRSNAEIPPVGEWCPWSFQSDWWLRICQSVFVSSGCKECSFFPVLEGEWQCESKFHRCHFRFYFRANR